MVYRDPETGQFRAGGNGGLSYADHDVQWILHNVTFLDTADSGPDTALADTQQFEITERGLDPDELAELRLLTVDVALSLDEGVVDQDEIGGFVASVDYGFNLAGEEYLSAGGTATNEDVDDSGTDDFTVITRDTDEVGQLGSHELAMYAGYSDTTDGTGGSASCPRFYTQIPFATMLGTGPVVDAVDDFTSRVRLTAENMVGGGQVSVRYGCYYAVEESETGRTRFGR
jgi:hypothetical protein